MGESWLVLDTSGRGGQVGLAIGERIARSARLDPTRRHCRDLAPTIGDLLAAEGRTPRDLTGVMVSHGPGSFTGLRVGVMTAKMLAYALGCRLIAVPTFHAIAEQSPPEARIVDVISDALQGHVYVQRFRRVEGSRWDAVDDLRIATVAAWTATLIDESWVSGPGIDVHDAAIPATIRRVAPENRTPTMDSLFAVGRRLPSLSREDVMRLEPLYLRASSAEEKAART